MTEANWLDSCNPTSMLSFLRGRAVSGRKSRLFAVACLRRIDHLLPDTRSIQALEVAEQFAEGVVGRQGLDAARVAAEEAAKAADREVGGGPMYAAAMAAAVICGRDPRATLIAQWAAEAASMASIDRAGASGEAAGGQAVLLREIFGTPHRPVAIEPAWLTPTVVRLAEAIRTERGFDRLPVLGDALEEAGCDDADILDHCRSQSEHVPGCWAVDAVLAAWHRRDRGEPRSTDDLLDELFRLAPPPKSPTAPGHPGEWGRVEQALGTPLPEDYKRIIEAYGRGCFNDLFYLFNPFSRRVQTLLRQVGTPEHGEDLDWAYPVDSCLEQYQLHGAIENPEVCPFGTFPEPGGLFPLGGDTNGGYAFWLTSGRPAEWTLAVFDDDFSECERYPMPLVEFLVLWLSGELPSCFSGVGGQFLDMTDPIFI
jgi:hypothetical protein